MNIKLEVAGKQVELNVSNPIDISIPIEHGDENPNAFYAPLVDFSPVRTDDFVGSTEEGGLVNFKNICINPHGNGTHTECVGHISKEPYTINQCLKQFHFLAQLTTLYPKKMENGDRVITKKLMNNLKIQEDITALIIRTTPNDETKLNRNYSGINPPYIHEEAMKWIVNQGIEHLVIDLPSVDKEEDEGKLLAHKAFWNYPGDEPRIHSTITELVYIPNEITDGIYLLNVLIASFEMDASPSKLLLYSFGL